MAAARAVAGGLFGATVAAMVVVLPVAVLVAPAALRFSSLTQGSAEAAGQARVGGLLVLMLLPQVPLYAVVGTATAVMNAQRRFALAAAAPALENLGTIAVLAAVAVLYPGARSVQDAPLGLILLLGLGTTGSVALHALVQWIGARRAGVALAPLAGWRHPEVRALIRRAVPSLAQAGLGALQIFVLIMLANRVAGGVVAFQLALNFFFLPIALAATPVALSLTPRLSRMTSPADAAAFRDTFVRGLSFAIFLVVPAATAYLAMAGPLAQAMSYGAFRAGTGALLVTASLAGLALGVIGETVFLVCTYTCYARGDTVTPLHAATVQATLTLTLAGATTTILTGPAALAGLGLAYTGGTALSAAMLLRAVLRRLPPGQASVLRAGGRALLCSLAMAGPAMLTADQVSRWAVPGAPVMAMAAAAAVGAGIYFGCQRMLRAEEMSWVGGALGQRLRLRLRLPRRPGRSLARRPARPGRRPAPRPRAAWATNAATLLGCLAAGAALAVSPLAAAALLVVFGLTLAVWARPAVATYLLIVVTPLTAGIDRGRLLPGLRPNEALLFLLVAIVAARAVLLARSGVVRLVRPNGIEVALLAMAVSSSVLPLAVMVLRSREISGDDIAHSIVLWKLLLTYAVARLTVTTQRQALRCLWLLLASGAAVSLVAITQSLGLFGVPGLLATYYAPFGVENALEIGRGSSTLSLPAAVADLATLTLLIALALLRYGGTRRLLLAAVALLSVFGVLAAAEFSTVFGMLLALAAFVVLTRSWRLLLYAPPIGVLAAVLLEPVIANRLAGFQSASGLPVSWIGRLRNLQTYFWPDLFSHWNWVFGVRPSARVASDAQEFGWIWIESGYTWLLWGGGLPLLAAYLALVVTTVRHGRRLATSPVPVTRAIGIAAACFILTDAFVMLFDPHVTYRGAAEAMLVLLALSRHLAPPPTPPPAPPPAPAPAGAVAVQAAPLGGPS